VLDRRRHAPVARSRATRVSVVARGLPQVYRGRARRTLADIYDADHAEGRNGGRFRWLMSTCLAAMVGATAIGVVIFGSLDTIETSNGLPNFKAAVDGQQGAGIAPQRPADGLRWAVPRSDRMLMMSGAPVVRHLIHEQIKVQRNGKAYIDRRPYVRLVTRLMPVPATNADVVPAFNPLALYGASPAAAKDGPQAARTDFKVQVLEMLGIAVPIDDGQELDGKDVADLVAQFAAEEAASAIAGSIQGGPSRGGEGPDGTAAG
jgi:hypothetical protein